MAEIGEGGGGEGRNFWKIFLWNCLRNRKIVLNFATAKGTEEQRRLRRSLGVKGMEEQRRLRKSPGEL